MHAQTLNIHTHTQADSGGSDQAKGHELPTHHDICRERNEKRASTATSTASSTWSDIGFDADMHRKMSLVAEPR